MSVVGRQDELLFCSFAGNRVYRRTNPVTPEVEEMTHRNSKAVTQLVGRFQQPKSLKSVYP